MRVLLRLLPFFLLIIISIPAATHPEAPHALGSTPVSEAPVEFQAAYMQVIDAFALYQTFLESDYRADGTFRLRNASTPSQAHAFLGRSFTRDMCKCICEAYTYWNPDRQELQLIPQDGLPILDSETQSRVYFYQKQEDCIVFTCNFYDCYKQGDAYRYSVTVVLEDGLWKIQAFDLRPIQPGVLEL